MKLLADMYKLQQLKVRLHDARKKRREEQNPNKDEEIEEEGIDGILEQEIHVASGRDGIHGPGTVVILKSIGETQNDVQISDFRTPTTNISMEERVLIEQIKSMAKKIAIQEKNGENNALERRKMEKKFKTRITDLIYNNLRNFGYWINASSFCISYTFIIYVYFNLTSAASANEKGIVIYSYLITPSSLL